MRMLLRTGPLLLALGVAVVIGCSESNGPQTKTPPSQIQARHDYGKPDKGEKPAAPTEARADEYVLTVEGMT